VKVTHMGRYGWDDDDDYYDRFPRKLTVGERLVLARKETDSLKQKGIKLEPLHIAGSKITSTFWGNSWCQNLERYSDYSNRLPRGRSYARNGSVIHLKMNQGTIEAKVQGSELYEISIKIEKLPEAKWKALKAACVGQIGSMIELLQGKLSAEVMAKVAEKEKGLFPAPKEIKKHCSCPDGASLCKHLAAVMYGIGHRLDTAPELLFSMRGVSHIDLIDQATPTALTKKKPSKKAAIADTDLSAIFGIDLGEEAAPVVKKALKTKAKPVAKKLTAKKPVVKKATKAK
jgi:uncharacterized Zn finger protein